MYLLNELLFLSPLAVYSAWRIRSLIPRRAFRNLSTLLFLLLVAGYPAAERLAHGPVSGGRRPLVFAGYYALPLLLYLVMAVILSDAVIGALRLARVLSRETVRRPACRGTRLAFLLATPALILAYGIWNHHHLRVSEYSIEVARRSSPVETLRIAFASDFHLGAMTDAHFMDKFVAKVNALDPDIILIGGDVMEGHRGDDPEKFIARFRELRSRYGVYAVPGNHERYGGGRSDFFERAGIRLLRDEVVTVGGAFHLAGRNVDGRSRHRKSLTDILRPATGDLPIILLDHIPDRLDDAARAGVDIQLSGHTHNGQLFPMNLIAGRVYELSWGHLVKGRTHFFVTSGVQLWGPPVRTAGVSEIMLINVTFKSAGPF
jgi:predicted MPP superfamily phosphohydrolase